MGDTLFISDLHLAESTPTIERGLAHFLEREQRAEALYVLGDLFEVWVGDDDDADLPARIAGLFADYSAAGPNLHFMVGNRDFMLGQDYAARCGAALIDDPTVIDLADQPTLLLHGDSLCTDDVEYQQFRAIARDPAWQAEGLKKSLDERRALARLIRETSRDRGSNKAEDILDVNAEAVADAFRAHSVVRMIHGHTHRPNRHANDSGERIVLGDWTDSGWCLRARGDELTLEQFSLL